MKDVFISHSSKDKGFVNKLASFMYSKGVSVWIDEGEILPGDRIREKINQGILESKYLAVVLSENSVDSNWVKVELDSAMIRELEDQEVVVIPLLLGAIENSMIPLDLRGKLYIDFRSADSFADGSARLVSSIKRRIEREYPYEIIHELYDLDFLVDDGSKVLYKRKKKIKALRSGLNTITEEFYSDGHIDVIGVNPGYIIEQQRTLGNVVLKIGLPRALARNEEISVSVDTLYLDSFPTESEFWLTNQANPIRQSEYIFRYSPGRPFKSYNFLTKRGVQETELQVVSEEKIIDGKMCLHIAFTPERLHEHTKICWTW